MREVKKVNWRKSIFGWTKVNWLGLVWSLGCMSWVDWEGVEEIGIVMCWEKQGRTRTQAYRNHLWSLSWERWPTSV